MKKEEETMLEVRQTRWLFDSVSHDNSDSRGAFRKAFMGALSDYAQAFGGYYRLMEYLQANGT